MSEWISVDDKLPKYGERVLVSSCKTGTVQHVTYYRDGHEDELDWWQDCLDDDDPILFGLVTHWMRLPEPPKK